MGITGIIDKMKDMGSRKGVVIDTPDTITIQPLEERKLVDIIVDRQIRTKYQKGWINKKRDTAIKEIVLHSTGGGTSAEGLLYWMMLGERAAEYYKGEALFHYLLDRKNPNIIEIISPEYWVYHSSSRSHDKETIGIEMVNPSKGNREAPTENQYTLLFNLIFKNLIPTYPTITSIVSHDHNMEKYSGLPPKGCPGAGFDWLRLEKEFIKNNIQFSKKGVGEYNIA